MNSDVSRPCCGAAAPKVDGTRGGVNLVYLAAFLVFSAGCGPSARAVPADVSPVEGGILLGGPSRSAGADQAPPLDPEVKWQVVVGRGILSPVIVTGPLLLVGTANHEVTALRTGNGDRYWNRKLDGPVSGGIAWQGRTLYVGNDEQGGKAYALELHKGKTVWDRKIGPVPFAPLVLGDTLIYATENGVILGIAAKSGKELWRARLRGSPRAAPLPFGDALVVPTSADSLYLLSAADGAIRKRHGLPGSVTAPPALAGDVVILGFFDGSAAAFTLPKLDPVWKADLGAPVIAPPVVAPDGNTYLLTTSAEVWRVAPTGDAERLAKLGGAASRSISLARDHLVIGRLDGTVFLLRRDGTQVWDRKLDGSVAAPATVHDGAVYVPLLSGKIVKLQ